MPWIDATESAEDTRAYLRTVMQGLAQGTEYSFAILEHGIVVGATGIRVVADAAEGEIGYWVSKDAEGRGIITRSSAALVQFAFEDLGLNRVVILCAVDNKRSRAVPERLGFSIEGTHRERDVNPSREPKDQVVYCLLRSTWDSGRSSAT